MRSNYQYVFLWFNTDYYKISMSDIINEKGIDYIDDFIYNKFQALHFSRKINNILNLPFKHIWYQNLINKYKSNKNKKLIFVFHSAIFFEIGEYTGLIDKLRNNFNCEIVIMFMDTVASYRDKYSMANKSLEERLSVVDYVFSYSKKDAEDYQMSYYPSMYSNILKYNTYEIDDRYSSDVFFVGQNKNRVKEIHQLYNQLLKNDINCKFFISGVKEEDKLINSNIIYNEYLDYDEVLKYVKNTKCVLEIVQENSEGFTFRDFECLLFNRKIITNNSVFLNSTYYNSELVYDLKYDSNLVKFIKKRIKADYNYNNDFSPLNFIKYLNTFL